MASSAGRWRSACARAPPRVGRMPSLHVRLKGLLASCRSRSYGSHSTGAGITSNHVAAIGSLLARRMRKSSPSRWASVLCCLRLYMLEPPPGSCRSTVLEISWHGAGTVKDQVGVVGSVLARRMRKSSPSRWASVLCCLQVYMLKPPPGSCRSTVLEISWHGAGTVKDQVGVVGSVLARRMRESSSSRWARARRSAEASLALTWPLRARSAFSRDSSATAFLRVSRSTFSLPISDLHMEASQLRLPDTLCVGSTSPGYDLAQSVVNTTEVCVSCTTFILSKNRPVSCAYARAWKALP